MFGQRELEELQFRKKALIIESDLNRLALEAECRSLRSAAAWGESTVEVYRKVRPWLLLLAPVTGLLLARMLRKPGSMVSRVISFMTAIRPLYSLWQKLTAKTPP